MGRVIDHVRAKLLGLMKSRLPGLPSDAPVCGFHPDLEATRFYVADQISHSNDIVQQVVYGGRVKIEVGAACETCAFILESSEEVANLVQQGRFRWVDRDDWTVAQVIRG